MSLIFELLSSGSVPLRKGGRDHRGFWASAIWFFIILAAGASSAPARADFVLPDNPTNRSYGVVGCIQRSSGTIDCPRRPSGSSSQGGGSSSSSSSSPPKQEDYRQRQIEADAIRKRQTESLRQRLESPDVQSNVSRGEYRARRQQNEAANTEAIRRLRQLREKSDAQKELPSIDRIEVPAPPAVEQQAWYRNGKDENLWGRIWRELTDSPERLAFDTWMNDPDHRQWLDDAMTIAFLPLYAEALIGAFPLKISARQALAESYSTLFPDMLKEPGAASGLKYAEGLQSVAAKHGVSFDIMGSLAETELGKTRRANSLLREVLPEFRQEKWWWSGSDLDVRFSKETLDRISPEKRLEVIKDIHQAVTGKGLGDPGGLAVDIAYSKYYPTEASMKGLPALRFEPGGWRQEMGWGAKVYSPSLDNKALYGDPRYGLNLRMN